MAAGPVPPSGAGPESFIDEAESPPPVFLLAAPPVFRAPSGPPARSPSAPRASLGASARSPARPRPRGFHVAFTNFACNSPATISNHGFAALKLQRFEALLNLRPIELHAKFVCSGAVVGQVLWCGEGTRPASTCSLLISLCGGACVRAFFGIAWREARGLPSVVLIWIGCTHLDRLCASG